MAKQKPAAPAPKVSHDPAPAPKNLPKSDVPADVLFRGLPGGNRRRGRPRKGVVAKYVPDPVIPDKILFAGFPTRPK